MLCSLEIGHLATEGLSRVVEAADVVSGEQFPNQILLLFMLAKSQHEKIKGDFKKACQLNNICCFEHNNSFCS